MSASRSGRARRPHVIGLMGGPAAGKSTVAAELAGLGLLVLDADRMAHELVASPEIAARIRLRFGPAVFGGDGRLDRAALGALVFADDGARLDLEAILHPPILQRIQSEVQQAQAAGQSVVLDVPLLLETGLDRLCDVLVFVDATDAARRKRSRARGWSEAELARRERAQGNVEVKRARATHIITNTKAIEDTRQQVRDLLSHITS